MADIVLFHERVAIVTSASFEIWQELWQITTNDIKAVFASNAIL